MPKKCWVPDKMVMPCSCGRIAYDRTDLAVIIENDHVPFNIERLGERAGWSKVVCLRMGCYGSWRSSRAYMERLPRIFNSEYLQQKEENKKALSSVAKQGESTEK
jgi:hypothetical protein